MLWFMFIAWGLQFVAFLVMWREVRAWEHAAKEWEKTANLWEANCRRKRYI